MTHHPRNVHQRVALSTTAKCILAGDRHIAEWTALTNGLSEDEKRAAVANANIAPPCTGVDAVTTARALHLAAALVARHASDVSNDELATCCDSPFPVWPSALSALRVHPRSTAVARASCAFFGACAVPLAEKLELDTRFHESLAVLTQGILRVNRHAASPLSASHGHGTASALAELFGAFDSDFDGGGGEAGGADVASAAFCAVGSLCNCKDHYIGLVAGLPQLAAAATAALARHSRDQSVVHQAGFAAQNLLWHAEITADPSVAECVVASGLLRVLAAAAVRICARTGVAHAVVANTPLTFLTVRIRHRGQLLLRHQGAAGALLRGRAAAARRGGGLCRRQLRRARRRRQPRVSRPVRRPSAGGSRRRRRAPRAP